jgi:hypothetical protein
MTEFEQGLAGLAALILGVSGLIVGGVMGTDLGRKDAIRSATIECVNKPKECKIRYDYYQIERKSDR